MKPGEHPAQFSAAIIAALHKLFLDLGVESVLDPFAGPGNRLAALCDGLGIDFAGWDIEPWPGRDARVDLYDATKLPTLFFVGSWVVTSPTYGNGINDHFEPKDTSTRYTYRIQAGHELHEQNSGRYSIRGGKKAWAKYLEINEAAVKRWHRARGAIVNVKDFIHDKEVVELGVEWVGMLARNGFEVQSMQLVETPGLRNGTNRDARVDGEWLIVATR